jgi:parvulin-like peptidyl-prolyl isomerase
MSKSNAFITINGQPISLEQALRYLQSSGKLESFLREILLRYVIEQELQALEKLEIDTELIEQTILEFRIANDLTDYESFQTWLANEGINYATFRHQIVTKFKLEQLKAQVSESNLQEYFIDRKLFLDRVVLSRLVVYERSLCEELKSQILEDGARFEQLVQHYSVAEDKLYNGMMGSVSRGSMPDELRVAIDLANPGDLIGPVQIEGLWYLMRVEKFLPASLDERIEQQLKDELFEQWLSEKVQQMNVQFQVKF